jgi:hypothetical protein
VELMVVMGHRIADQIDLARAPGKEMG